MGPPGHALIDGIMLLLAIDPGPKDSAFVTYKDRVLMFGTVENDVLLAMVEHSDCTTLCVEKVVSYGMAVGEEVFETVWWSGRFHQAFHGDRYRLPRLAVKQHICHSGNAKDPNIRQALIDRFGGKDCIRKGGPLYKMHGDEWAALACAVTCWETMLHG